MPHTPEPWALKGQGVVTPEGVEFARAEQIPGMSATECDDNARLIAAAPYLLRVLEELMGAVSMWSDPDKVDAAWCAIDFAKGKNT